MTETYRVVIKGLKEGSSKEQVISNLAALLKISSGQVRLKLESSSFVIKKGASLQATGQYISAIEKCGAVCVVEQEIDSEAASMPVIPSSPTLFKQSGIENTIQVYTVAMIKEGVIDFIDNTKFRMGDVAALLTNAEPLKNPKADLIWKLEITIGEGPAARLVYLDLPPMLSLLDSLEMPKFLECQGNSQLVYFKNFLFMTERVPENDAERNEILRQVQKLYGLAIQPENMAVYEEAAAPAQPRRDLEPRIIPGADEIFTLEVDPSSIDHSLHEHLASGDLTPDDLVETAIIKLIEIIYIPAFIFYADYKASWSASFGYDREEHYTAYEEKTEYVNGSPRTRHVPVTKTKTVTDWRPASGMDEGSCKVMVYAGNAYPCSNLVENITGPVVGFSSRLIANYQTEAFKKTAEQSYNDRGKDRIERYVEASVKSHAKGDRQQDWNWNSSWDKTVTTAFVPIGHAVFEYKENQYGYWISGTGSGDFRADTLPTDSDRERRLKISYFPAYVAIACLPVSGLIFHEGFWGLLGAFGFYSSLSVFLAWEFAVYRNKAILSYSQKLRSHHLSAKYEDSLQKSKPSRPLLAITSKDYILIPLLCLLFSFGVFYKDISESIQKEDAQRAEQKAKQLAMEQEAANQRLQKQQEKKEAIERKQKEDAINKRTLEFAQLKLTPKETLTFKAISREFRTDLRNQFKGIAFDLMSPFDRKMTLNDPLYKISQGDNSYVMAYANLNDDKPDIVLKTAECQRDGCDIWFVKLNVLIQGSTPESPNGSRTYEYNIENPEPSHFDGEIGITNEKLCGSRIYFDSSAIRNGHIKPELKYLDQYLKCDVPPT